MGVVQAALTLREDSTATKLAVSLRALGVGGGAQESAFNKHLSCCGPLGTNSSHQGNRGAPGWHSRFSIRFLISAHFMISGSWNEAPQWARTQHSQLETLPLLLLLLLLLSLSVSNKEIDLKKKPKNKKPTR